jgi:hypothetical protein
LKSEKSAVVVVVVVVVVVLLLVLPLAGAWYLAGMDLFAEASTNDYKTTIKFVPSS